MINVSEVIREWEADGEWRVSPGVGWCAAGNRVKIGVGVIIVGKDVKIGNYVKIGKDVIIAGGVRISAGVEIGDYVEISAGVTIIDDDVTIGDDARLLNKNHDDTGERDD